MNNDFRYDDIAWTKTDAKEFIYPAIRPESRVLDLGCWTGRLGDKLKKEKSCYVVGVEINKKAIALAKSRLDEVYQIDLDQPELLVKSIKQKFDFIILADVLEHLKDPEKLLVLLKQFLNKDGCLLISVPNIAYWRKRLSLLCGKFEYEKTGILDETHLRHFTKASAKEMIEKAGYQIEKIYFTGTKFLPTLKAYQFVFVCKI